MNLLIFPVITYNNDGNSAGEKLKMTASNWIAKQIHEGRYF